MLTPRRITAFEPTAAKFYTRHVVCINFGEINFGKGFFAPSFPLGLFIFVALRRSLHFSAPFVMLTNQVEQQMRGIEGDSGRFGENELRADQLVEGVVSIFCGMVLGKINHAANS